MVGALRNWTAKRALMVARWVRRGGGILHCMSDPKVNAIVMSHAQFRDAIKTSDSLLSTVLGAAADRLRRDSLDRGKAL